MKLIVLTILSTYLVLGECCPSGYFEDEEGDCEVCPQGHWCEEGASEPSPCPVGTFGPYQARTSNTTCYPCSPGDYNEEEGSARCKQCMPGYYCPSGSVKPSPCPKGTSSGYTRASRIDLCRNCTAGLYNDEVGQRQCKACPVNNYCEAGSLQPTPCPEGTISGAYSRSIASCRPAPPPRNCSLGWYKNEAGVCVYCPPGLFCEEGATAPTKCPVGTFNPYSARSSNSSCTPCNRGDFNGEEEAARCTQCMPGYYCPTSGLVKPTPCPVGTASPYTRSSTIQYCRNCTAGRYNDEEGQRQCKTCPENNYCETGSVEPTPCPDGYISRTYSRSVKDCRPKPPPKNCTAGYYKNEEGKCIYCPKGHYCEGPFDPVKCPVGTFRSSYGGSSNRSCYPCSPGDYSGEEGAERCNQCQPGYYCTGGSAKPAACPIGTASPYTRSSRIDWCRNCTAGRYNDEQGQKECKVCPESNYCETGSSEPTPCPEGHTSRTYSRSVRDCRPIRPVPGNCTAGYFKNKVKECSICPKGHYCEGPFDPVKCPVGTFGPNNGARSNRSCYDCYRGYYSDQEGAERCNRCEPGYFCTGKSAKPEACPVGTASPYISSSSIQSCRNCTAGRYNDEMGQKECKPCPENNYCETGSSEPTPCPKGYISRIYSRSERDCRPEA